MECFFQSFHYSIFQETNERHTHIAVDTIEARNRDRIHVIYTTTKGMDVDVVKKYSFNTATQDSCLVEVLHPFEGAEDVNDFQFTKATNSLYIATDSRVIRLKSERCGRHLTRQQCLDSMDPYCGWDRNSDNCQRLDEGKQYLEQERIKCPRLNTPVSRISCLAKY